MHTDEIDAGLEALIRRYEAELAPLSDEELDRRPPDGGWSARECIGHLTLTVELYNEELAALVTRAPAAQPERPSKVRPTLVGRLLIGVLGKEGPKKKKVSSPKAFKPDRVHRAYDVAGLVAAHEALRDHGRAVLGTRQAARKIASPISRMLRLRAHEAFEVQVLHGRRHLEQALRAAEVTPA